MSYAARSLRSCVLLAFLAVATYAGAACAAETLENRSLRAEFDGRGLVAICDKAAGTVVRLEKDGFAVQAGDDLVDSALAAPPSVQRSSDSVRTYCYESGVWRVRVVYELRPEWRFVSKQIFIDGGGKKDARIARIEMMRGEFAAPIAETRRIRDGALLRMAEAEKGPLTHGLFFSLQNPFLQFKNLDKVYSLAYAPDMVWKAGGGPFVSDRLCLGPYVMSGIRLPALQVPEWKYVPGGKPLGDAWIDEAEVSALVECVRAFLLWKPTHSTRVHVGWCDNDYQIDIGTAEGRAEYKRIIDRAAAVGCTHLLFGPANNGVSSLDQNRDAWGWENLLWLSLGQKIRKGEWEPGKDEMPASVKEMIDYAKNKDVTFLAYVYPSLPFMQDKEWTAWVKGQPGGYLGADTGQRSFQDWLVNKLVDFRKATGAGGYSFDHWWIAYDDTPSSKYAQWAGCRRVLEELRRRAPDAVIDGRQQYHWFGAWTWLAGTYPHPLCSDEQPESFRAFPDLHFDRVSADRQRRTAWFYRMECFVPTEIMPGYISHQTPRNDAKGACRRDRFRARDWDDLGWRYSVISSIGTAPTNHVVNMLPARDEKEFKSFLQSDEQWMRAWFDWTDRNFDTLRNLRPILGPPQVGAVDGTAAFKDGRGFVFLFNPNYRPMQAEFKLDKSIGLDQGGRFVLRQVYPDAEKGKLLLSPEGDAWKLGDKAVIALPGAEALVIAVEPAAEGTAGPVVLGVKGDASLVCGVLALENVVGEAGVKSDIRVALAADDKVTAVKINGVPVKFLQQGRVVTAQAVFGGAPFAARQQVGAFLPDFTGGTFRAETTLPKRVFEQLEKRKERWPIAWTEEDLQTTWLASQRLLLFINIADPDDETMKVSLKIDGQSVDVKPAYSAIVRSNPKNTFVGWYADVSSLKPDVQHAIEVELPKLEAGRFQGLFFDTIEAEYTTTILPSP